VFLLRRIDRNRKNIRKIKIKIFDSPENCKFLEVN